MDLSKIKLIVSDMDGTLLNSNHEISTLFFDLFCKIKNHKIIFVAASGRPYYSITEKLTSIKDDIIIVAENGALVVEQNNILLSLPIISENLLKIMASIHNLKSTHAVFCCEKEAYIMNTSKHLLYMLSEYYSNYKLIDSFDEIKKPVYKVALFNEESSEKHIFPVVKHLRKNLKVIVSAKNWLDISEKTSHKGNALKLIQKKYGINESETLAFGDYNNDIEMLKLSKFSYAMENAHQDVKSISRFKTKSNNENGVELILEKVLASKKG